MKLFIVPHRLRSGLPLGHTSSCFRSWRRPSWISAMVRPPILSLALPSKTARVLSIQSHTVQPCLPFDKEGDCGSLSAPSAGQWGYVGNKSAVFPLQLFGYDVDPINSVQFSNNTGYPTYRGHVLNGAQLLELIEGLAANDLLSYTHLLTGYIGSISFLHAVLQVVDRLRTVNPGLVYVCDPVMGDGGKLYVPLELVSVYRDKVVPIASMLTPNQFEVELLTGVRITSESDGLEACNILHAAGPSMVVITSLNLMGKLLLIGSHQKVKRMISLPFIEHYLVHRNDEEGIESRIAMQLDDVYNLGGKAHFGLECLNKVSVPDLQGQFPQQFKIVIPKIPAYFTGTGDLMTALLLGWSNKYPENLEKASELAVSSLQALLQRTLADYKAAGFDPQSSSLEIRLIQSQDDIKNPEVKFKAEKFL